MYKLIRYIIKKICNIISMPFMLIMVPFFAIIIMYDNKTLKDFKHDFKDMFNCYIEWTKK
jgi:hypothetical protein